MPTPLHDPSTLEALADGQPGEARDWANTRLALVRPSAVRALPAEPSAATLCLAAGATRAVDGLLERLREQGRKDGAAASLVDAAFAFGLVPVDVDPWREAVTGALRGNGREADAVLARAAFDLGGVDGSLLAACARVETEGARGVLAGLVLRFAVARGEDVEPVARDVAGPLAAHGDVGLATEVLGLPRIDVQGDPEDAVREGCRLAATDAPDLPRTHGSVRRRAARLVHALLHDATGPAAALLRALVSLDASPDPVGLVAQAAWLASRTVAPSEALSLVVDVAAGEDRILLSEARRLTTDTIAAELSIAVSLPGLSSVPTLALCGSLLVGRAGQPDVLHEAVVARTLLSGLSDPRSDAILHLALAQVPDRIAGYLSKPNTRAAGLMFARLANTEEVLAALLDMPVPAQPGPRGAWAWALADQGDRAAADRLASAVVQWPDEAALAEAATRARALLDG